MCHDYYLIMLENLGRNIMIALSYSLFIKRNEQLNNSIPNLIQNGNDSTNDTNSISSLLRTIYIDQQSIAVVLLSRSTLSYKTIIAKN